MNHTHHRQQIMKNNTEINSTNRQKSETTKKSQKIRKKLKKLYIEYEYLSITKINKARLSKLIDIISKTEYKYVCYLKDKR